MGIKNFHKFLRKHAPELYQEIHISQFKGKTIAIDINIYLYKYKSTHKERWINMLFMLLLQLKQHQINCVCIYDTKAPVEKNARKAERRQRKKNAEDKIFEIQEALQLYHSKQIVSPILLEICAKKDGKLKKLLKLNTDTIDIALIHKEIVFLSNQIVNITRQDVDTSKELLSVLGIPFFNADGEAETLCSYLCCHHQVDAVLSDDTDVLVYGTPIFITKLNVREGVCVVLNPEKIVQVLNISFEQFVDLCIMSGTDYNDNIPNVGNEKAYKLLLKYKSIEGIEHSRPELSCDGLNYKRIREIFHTPSKLPSYDTTNTPIHLPLLNEFALRNRIHLNSNQLKMLIQ